MNKLFKLSMFITSFIPLWLSVAFLDILSLTKSTENCWTEKIGLCVITLAILGSVVVIVKSIKAVRPSEYKDYIILNVAQEKGITSEFLLSYILPLFAFDFTVWSGVVQFLIYFIVLAFLCIRNNNVYANLVFELQKYKFYICDLKWKPEESSIPFQAIVISKVNLCAKQGNTISTTPLNKPFFIVE